MCHFPSHYGSLPLLFPPSSCSLPVSLPVPVGISQIVSYSFFSPPQLTVFCWLVLSCSVGAIPSPATAFLPKLSQLCTWLLCIPVEKRSSNDGQCVQTRYRFKCTGCTVVSVELVPTWPGYACSPLVSTSNAAAYQSDRSFFHYRSRCIASQKMPSRELTGKQFVLFFLYILQKFCSDVVSTDHDEQN